MSKALIILEQHFVEYNSVIYTDVQCSANFWDRYLNVFDEIVVLARLKKVESLDADRLLISSHDRVSFVSLPDFSRTKGIIKNWRKNNFILEKTLNELHPDVVIFRAPSPISLCFQKRLIKSNVKFAVEVMMNPKTAYSYSCTKSLISVVLKHFMHRHLRKICKNAYGVSYVTEYSLQKEYPCSNKAVTASYSTIDLKDDDFSYVEKENFLNREIILTHSAKLADYRKGTDIFIELLNLINQSNIKFKAYIVGDGIKMDDFKKMVDKYGINDKVVFTGWIAGYKKMKQILEKSDFFVFPTKSEGLPRTIIEAMANSVLPIASNVDGIPELLLEDCMVNNFDSKDYFNTFMKYYNDFNKYQEDRKIMYEKSLKYNNKDLSLERTKFYSKLILKNI